MAPRLDLLGRPLLEWNDRRIEPPATKVSAVLFYLAYQGGWVHREQVAGLMWPEVDEDNARANLRKILNRARKLPWAADLEAERSRLRWEIPTDVGRFERALAEDDAAGIEACYRGPLLEGFRVEDAPGFEDWLEVERDRLHSAWRSSLARHVTGLEAARPQEAIPLLRTLIDDDRLDEQVLQSYLRCARGQAERGRALRAYERFRDLLENEMGLEPLEGTALLAERLRDDPGATTSGSTVVALPRPAAEPATESVSAADPQPVAAPTRTAAPELPRDATPFIDRPEDLQRIAAKLDDADCRLLTLVGPGGVGKTRLAQRVLLRRESRYRDGVAAVPLATVETRAELVDAVARGFGLDARGDDPVAQLFAHLRDRHALLLLDNFEQLAADADWLSELLRAAPELELLMTSRESLGVRGEWIHQVEGLPFPPEGDGDPDAWPAVALFRQTAARHDVAPRPGDAGAIARICRFVEGTPLAIELAANWVRVLRIDEIADELEHDPELLSSAERDLPARHRSMEAVFTRSWQLLTPEQQRTLARLSIFRGDFDRAAATTVAGASTRALLELVGKSLLRRHADGRFDLHPLVRQYARRELEALPDEERDVRERHGVTYLERLHQLNELRRQGRIREALDGFDREYANLRDMWQWAVAGTRVDELEQMAGAVEQYFIQRNRLREGIGVLGDAVDQLDETDPGHHTAIGRLLVCRGWLFTRSGEYDQGRRHAERAQALLAPLGASLAHAECLSLQGAILGLTGAYESSRALFERAFAMAEEIADERLQAYYLNNLAIAEKELGNYRRAEELYRRALVLGRRFGEHVTVARNLNNLGLLLLAREDLDGAADVLQEGRAIAEAMGFEQPLAHLHTSLGAVAFERGAYDEARSRFLDALERVRRSHSRALEAELLGNLGLVAVAQGDPEAATLFRHGLELARSTGSTRLCLDIATGIARLLAERGEHDEAAEILAAVMRHPATSSATRRRAARLADEIPDQPDEGRITGDDRSGSEVWDDLLERLPSLL